MPGLSNSSYVEIKSGLAEGDTVYYTESRNVFGAMGFGGMGGGQRGDFSGGGEMPSGDFGGGGDMPSGGFGGGEAPSGGMGGGMPGGN